jgi:hypothetical protein
LSTGTSHVSSRLRKTAGLRVTTTRIAITFIFVVLVISSPIVMFINPTLPNVSGAPLPTISTILSAPSTISQGGQDGDFTTQAALSLTRATQTSNIVNSKSYYDISFRTTSTGIINTIQMTLPPGTYAGAALLVETVGIGPGTIATSGSTSTGQTITYTVTNAVNVPANTKIKIQLSNINNPSDPSSALTVSITTREASNAIIDGPTVTNAYNIKQIGTDDIADDAITNSKIADGAVTTDKIDLSSGPIAFSTSSQTSVSLMNPIDPTTTVINVAGSGAGITIFPPGDDAILDGADGQYLILFGISDTNQIRISNGANIILPNNNPSITICCQGG